MEKKKIEDYLKYHIGCEVIGKYLDEDRKGYLSGVNNGGFECEIQFFEEDGFNVFEEPEFNESSEVKLCLRKLPSMLKEDILQLFLLNGLDFSKVATSAQLVDNNILIHYKCAGDILTDEINITKISAEQFHYLLSKGFDLFGLIDAGLALDAETIK